MATILNGDRIARQGALLLVCSAVVFDEERRVLLTRRVDNGRWCLPGGHCESGESVTEAVIREVKEETGLDVDMIRMTGVYSSPHRLLEYAEGDRFHLVALNFEVRATGGTLTLSDETNEFAWCTRSEIEAMDVMEHHLERIDDALRGEAAACVR